MTIELSRHSHLMKPESAKSFATIQRRFTSTTSGAFARMRRRLNAAFGWCDGFKEYFAVKATPNPYILKIAKEEGFGADCSSLPELVLAARVGITGENIMFTSNDTPFAEYQRAKALGAIINLDDITHLRYVEERAGGLPELICFRYNPGPLRGGNAIIGKPEEAKYGLTRPQLFEAYASARKKGSKRFGLHTMVASNELNLEFFIETARMLFDLAVELAEKLGVRLEFVNLGGGIGIPYRPEQKALDLEALGQAREGALRRTDPAGGVASAAGLHGEWPLHHRAVRVSGNTSHS